MGSTTTTYRVPGMSCGHCRAAIEAALCEVPGVEGVHVDLAGRTVSVSGSGLHDDALRAAIGEAGYEAE